MKVDASTSQTEGGRATRRLAPDAAGVAAAARALAAGRLVAFPTETVYGLGGDATSGAAVAAIYAAKGRPSFNPLISHVADVATARREGLFNADAERLAEAFWPGPLTLVLPVAPTCQVSDLARAGLDSVALRVPAHALARDLLAAVGLPVAAPSANRSGHVSPTNAAHVLDDLAGRIDAVLDGGACPVGVESTIIGCLDERPLLLRPGGVAREEIEAALGKKLGIAEAAPAHAPLAPGMLISHYAPRALVRLDATRLEWGEVGLDFGGLLGGGALDLSPSGDLREAAANLFTYLRRLDATGAPRIAAAPVPHVGLGDAIRDRLARAAAGR
jgi:L-threonylcarbamoyladenylate synthase